MSNRLVLATALSLWGGALLYGLIEAARWEGRPGIRGLAPCMWPEGSSIPRVDGDSTLIVFSHPLCPCTRATLGELARIVARAPANLQTLVVFAPPKGAPQDWEASDLRRLAEEIPRVRVLTDRGCVEARRFGARTSGDTLLFDAGGRLRFHGGITGSRGHEGDNLGRAAVLAILRGDSPAPSSSPVFGCPLEDGDGVDDGPPQRETGSRSP